MKRAIILLPALLGAAVAVAFGSVACGPPFERAAPPAPAFDAAPPPPTPTPPPPVYEVPPLVADAGVDAPADAGVDAAPPPEEDAGTDAPPGCAAPCLFGQRCDGWTCVEDSPPCVPGTCCDPDPGRWGVVGNIAVDSAHGRRMWRRDVQAAKYAGPAELVCEGFGPGWRLPTVDEAASVRILNEEPDWPHACLPPMDPAVFTPPWWKPSCMPPDCPIKILLTADHEDGGAAASGQVILYPLPQGTLVQWQNGGPFYCTHDPL